MAKKGETRRRRRRKEGEGEGGRVEGTGAMTQPRPRSKYSCDDLSARLRGNFFRRFPGVVLAGEVCGAGGDKQWLRSASKRCP